MFPNQHTISIEPKLNVGAKVQFLQIEKKISNYISGPGLVGLFYFLQLGAWFKAEKEHCSAAAQPQ